ncbi:MAG: LrgB family protein [Flavonifractor plautii]
MFRYWRAAWQGSAVSLGSVLALCRLFEMEDMLTASLLPKSVTTAIAVGIAESRGGVGGHRGGGGGCWPAW